jgi:hypothetical protein
MVMEILANIVRSKRDPKVISSGPSSFSASDRMARNLGWFSFGLGALEICAPRQITRALGMEGQEALVRAYGFRELAAGMLSLSVEKDVGLWSRVAGDGLDIATLVTAWRADNPKKANVATALLLVVGITVLDIVTAQEVGRRHERPKRPPRLYPERTGFPKGIEAVRGLAGRKKQQPRPQAVAAFRGSASRPPS